MDRIRPDGTADPTETIEDPQDPLIDRAVADIGLLQGNFAEPYPSGGGAVTNANVFRGAAYGDRFGPYLSQFLLRGNTTRCRRGAEIRDLPEAGVIPEGSVPNLQRQATIEPYIDYLRNECEWRCVEQGADDPSGTDATECGGNRFIRNLRDLGQWVHLDDPAQHYRNAAFLLFNEPPLMRDPGEASPPDGCGGEVKTSLLSQRLNVGQRPLDFSGTSDSVARMGGTRAALKGSRSHLVSAILIGQATIQKRTPMPQTRAAS